MAGLFYRGASKAAEANPGFRFEQGVVVELDSSLAGYDEAESRRVYRSVLERVREIPGVRSASLASSIPFGMFSDGRQVGRPGTRQALDEGLELSEADRPVYANYTLITDGYFQSLGTSILRDFYNEGLVMWMFETGCRLFLTFALVALLLAVAGVYGVKSFVVARRTREIGIRMALGATTGQVLWMILREGMRLTAIGLALGCVLALGAGQLLRSMLFGISAADPLSLGAALVVLTVASLAACYLPARRAARIQPMRALHCE